MMTIFYHIPNTISSVLHILILIAERHHHIGKRLVTVVDHVAAQLAAALLQRGVAAAGRGRGADCTGAGQAGAKLCRRVAR